MTSFQTLFEDRGNPGIELVTRLGFTEEIHFSTFHGWLPAHGLSTFQPSLNRRVSAERNQVALHASWLWAPDGRVLIVMPMGFV